MVASDRAALKALGHLEVWLVTGSQEMYGQATLRQVEQHARQVAAGLDEQAEVPVRVVHREVATSPGSIRSVVLEANAADSCVGVIAWMHTFSPGKMWIAGLSALQKPLLHLHTQFNRDLPWAEIDMDFMNLNQSAHGDREFGFVESRMRLRRKTVVGHWRDPQVAARIGAWARAAAGWREAQRASRRPLRRQHARGRGHRRRQGRGADPAGRVGQRLRRRGARRGGRGRRGGGRRAPRGGVRGGRTTSRPRCAGKASAASRCATPPGSRPGCAGSSTRVGFGRSPTPSRTSTTSLSCRASRRNG